MLIVEKKKGNTTKRDKNVHKNELIFSLFCVQLLKYFRITFLGNIIIIYNKIKNKIN